MLLISSWWLNVVLLALHWSLYNFYPFLCGCETSPVSMSSFYKLNNTMISRLSKWLNNNSLSPEFHYIYISYLSYITHNYKLIEAQCRSLTANSVATAGPCRSFSNSMNHKPILLLELAYSFSLYPKSLWWIISGDTYCILRLFLVLSCWGYSESGDCAYFMWEFYGLRTAI